MVWMRYVGIAIFMLFGYSLFSFFLSVMPPKVNSSITPGDLDMEYENISFTTEDGIEIAGWWVPGKETNKTVILGHGYPFDKGNILQATSWLSPDYNLLYYDHRSFGESQGWFTTAGARERLDVEAGIEHAVERTEEPIILYGFSLSGASMLLANKSDVNGMIIDSAYATLQDIIERNYFFLGPFKLPFVELAKLYGKIFFGINTDSVRPVDEIRGLDIPVFLIHGSDDKQIPVDNTKRLYKAANKNSTKLWIVEGASHGRTISKNKEEYQSRIKEFIDSIE